MTEDWCIAEATSETGFLRLDAEGRAVTCSPGAARLLGIDSDGRGPDRASLLDRVADTDRAVLAMTLAGEAPGRCRIRLGERTLEVQTTRLDHGHLLATLRDTTATVERTQRLEAMTDMLRMAEHIAGIGHWRYDLATRAVHWSEGLFHLHGFDPNETEPSIEEILDRLHPEDAAHLATCVEKAAADGTPYDLHLRLLGEGLDGRVLRGLGQPVRDVDGRIVALFGITEDRTERLSRERHMRLLSDVVESTMESVLITDNERRITWVNPAFTQRTGYTLDEARGQSPGALLQGPGTDPEKIAFMRDHLDRGEGFALDLLNYRKDGSPHFVHLSVRPRRGPGGELLGFMSVQVDLSELQQAREDLERQRHQLRDALFRLQRRSDEQERLLEETRRSRAALQREVQARRELGDQLRRMAMFDTLTGVPNRRHLLGLLRTEVSRARRYGRPLTVALLDIDHFKRINDTWGHASGDACLVGVARRIQDTLRDVDTIGRTGGEEFVVVLPETDLLGAQTTAERIRRAIAETPFEDEEGHRIDTTVSLGLAELAPLEDADSLVLRADEAMYQAKSSGRNRWCVAPEPGHRGDRIAS